jgi:hypothetical protein
MRLQFRLINLTDTVMFDHDDGMLLASNINPWRFKMVDPDLLISALYVALALVHALSHWWR